MKYGTKDKILNSNKFQEFLSTIKNNLMGTSYSILCQEVDPKPMKQQVQKLVLLRF